MRSRSRARRATPKPASPIPPTPRRSPSAGACAGSRRRRRTSSARARQHVEVVQVHELRALGRRLGRRRARRPVWRRRGGGGAARAARAAREPSAATTTTTMTCTVPSSSRTTRTCSSSRRRSRRGTRSRGVDAQLQRARQARVEEELPPRRRRRQREHGGVPRDTVFLRFGKMSKTRFSLDFRYPLSPLVALGIACTTFAKWSSRETPARWARSNTSRAGMCSAGEHKRRHLGVSSRAWFEPPGLSRNSGGLGYDVLLETRRRSPGRSRSSSSRSSSYTRSLARAPRAQLGGALQVALLVLTVRARPYFASAEFFFLFVFPVPPACSAP